MKKVHTLSAVPLSTLFSEPIKSAKCGVPVQIGDTNRLCDRNWLVSEVYKTNVHSDFGQKPSITKTKCINQAFSSVLWLTHLVLWPQMGLLYQPLKIWIWSICGMATGRENQNCSKKNLLHCYFVHDKPHMHYLATEPRPLSWKARKWTIWAMAKFRSLMNTFSTWRASLEVASVFVDPREGAINKQKIMIHLRI